MIPSAVRFVVLPVLLLIGSAVSLPLRAQTPISDSSRLAQIKGLLAEQHWQEIVRLAETDPIRSADLNYYYGTALARLERWNDARKAFQEGLRQQPDDRRFPIELAGVSFKQKNYSEAAEHLRHALRLAPADPYANDFLAGVYFLQGNLEAALKHWNRVSKPQIEEVRFEPTPKVDPVLLDHAFAFAPATVLRLSELRTTATRIDGLKIFPNHRFDLEARPDGKFDVVFRAQERNGWGSNRWHTLLSLLRGLPFQTVHPEYFNLDRRAINFVSLFRWDSEKRRLWTNLSGPLSRDPKWRYQFDLDLRNENWAVFDSFSSPTPAARLNIRKQTVGGALTSFSNGRRNWSTGVELSHRDFRDVIRGDSLTPELLSQGFQLKHLAQVNYELVRAPERRLTIGAGGSTQLGRIWSRPSRVFAKLQGSLQAQWLPQASGDDFEVRQEVRAGKTFGDTPFDELFILGIERDNDLWLRAHVGTRDGRKGSAPMGRNYFLSNWELNKNVYNNGLLDLKLGPFLDSGRVIDSSSGLGSRKWLWDLGIQARIRVVGVGLRVSYGKDLRTGKDAFYVTFR